jgi:penicillin-binding protein 2
MGIHVMDDWLRKFMVNSLTGIDLPGEVRSLIPTPARLEQQEHASWTVGWNLNTVIGQGISQYTMIALVRAYSAIANGGTLYKPELVSSITTAAGKPVKTFKPVVQGKIKLPSWVWNTVHKGMEDSAQDSDIAGTGTSGTGYPTLVGFPLPLASKTGTAQKAGPYNNAFFLTEGPMPHPSILIYVYIDNGNWGAYSGYVARAIYDQYFKVKDPTAQASFDSIFGYGKAWPFGYTAPKKTSP